MSKTVVTRPPGQKSDYLITNRRRDEDARNIMLETTAYYAKTGLQSQFEESTNLAIRRKKLNHRLEELLDQERAKLSQRQEKLKKLFQEDDIKYRQELIAQESTRDSRVDAMRNRVAELKGKREKERKKIVEEKLLQKWKAECDELRRAQSLLLGKKVSEQRASQIQEKQEQLSLALKEKKHFDLLWEHDRQKKIAREEQDRLARHKLNQGMIKMLGEQLVMLKAQAQEEEKLKQEEARLMRQEYENRVFEEERNRKNKLLEQKQIQLELDAFNIERIRARQKEAKESLDMDLKMLEEYLRQDEAERALRAAKRESLKREMQIYRDHLLEQKRVEKERQEEIEKLYKKEDEKLWAKRAEKWRKEQRARDKLMKEVMAGRQEQVQYHLQQNRLAQEQVKIEKEKLEAAIESIRQEDAKKLEKHQKSAAQYCDDLFDQIQKTQLRRVEERKRSEAEDKAHRDLSKKYDHILEQEMAKLTSNE